MPAGPLSGTDPWHPNPSLYRMGIVIGARMSVLELEYPPVLTPRLLSSLNGRLDDSKRTELKSVLALTIDQYFKPFARYQGPHYARRLDEIVLKYQPYRLWLSAKLFEFLGKDLLLTLPALLAEHWGLHRKEDWERVGVKHETMAKIFGRYGKALKRLFSPTGKGGWPSTPTHALKRLIDSFILVASHFDFSVTSLCLMLEGEIKPRPRIVKVLVEAARRAISSYETHVGTLCREPVKLEDYFFRLLFENNLWTASEEQDFPANGGSPFRPLEMAGKPLSEMILEDRR
ncbi:MAG TPA: hypothetical protein VJB14_00410 [Planctomycetota bacterium]|nr:hypothetical protein [Planctomycetota bacterium]